MNLHDTNATGAKGPGHDEQLLSAENAASVSAELKLKYREWADNWFAGNACCPVCGGDDMQVVRTRRDDAGRIEDWRCASGPCGSGWRVELRESALGIYRDADGIDADWYERVADAPTFRIIVEEGMPTGIRTPEGSARPDPYPQFIVRCYDQSGLDENHSRGTDSEGRDYCEYRLPDTKQGGATPVETHSLLVASTGHVTAEEAQALTDHGYARGEYGWLLYVGQGGITALSELEPLSAGFREVIRQARKCGCAYVLLDRDADPLEGVPTYSW